MIKDVEPTSPNEYILKGVVNAVLGQDQGSVSFSSSFYCADIMVITISRTSKPRFKNTT